MKPKPGQSLVQRNLSILGMAGVVVIVCVCALIFVVTFRNSSRPPATSTPQPQAGATIEFITPTDRPEKTVTPEVTETAQPRRGNTRNNPYPIDSKVEIGGGMVLSIVFVTRPADEIVLGANRFNDPAPAGEEYLLVALHIDCDRPADKTCVFIDSEIKTVGTNGSVRDNARVSDTPNAFEYGSEFFGGSSIEGNIVFLARKEDPVILFYDPLFFGDPSSYIALQ